MGVRHHWRLFKAYTTLHLKSAMEYRVNFLTQSFFMLLNDTLWIFVWYFLFGVFKNINGYSLEDSLIIFGIAALTYGILSVFFGNRREAWSFVTEGGLDFYLALPADELFHVLISKSAYDGVGDILFGILILALIAPHALLIGLLVSILGAIILLAFMILISCTAFWMENPKSSTEAMQNFVLGFATWPLDIFGPAARVILYTIPVAFIATVPHHIIAQFSWYSLGVLALVAALMLALSILVWKFGLRRYESGNMMTTRT